MYNIIYYFYLEHVSEESWFDPVGLVLLIDSISPDNVTEVAAVDDTGVIITGCPLFDIALALVATTQPSISEPWLALVFTKLWLEIEIWSERINIAFVDEYRCCCCCTCDEVTRDSADSRETPPDERFRGRFIFRDDDWSELPCWSAAVALEPGFDITEEVNGTIEVVNIEGTDKSDVDIVGTLEWDITGCSN